MLTNPLQNQEYLKSIKNDRDPKTLGIVCGVSCGCGQAYIGITKHSINTRFN